MKASLLTIRKHLLFLVALGSIQAYAGGSIVLSKTETIEITNPTQAFACHPGDGGFIFPTLSLNTFSIPREFGENFRNTRGISAYLPNQNGAESCINAMKTIAEEIQKQGGQLKVLASRSLDRFAYFDDGCQLFLTDMVQITFGSLSLSGVTTFSIGELPVTSPFKCNDLIPGKI